MDIEMKSGIAILRAGESHPQGREEIKRFDYHEGQPLARFYGQVIEQVFLWAQESGVTLQELATQTTRLRELVELSGGTVTKVTA